MAESKFKGKSIKTFSDEMAYLSQFSEEGSILGDYAEIEPTEHIDTGNYLYNAHVSGSILKGYPNNAIITVAGDPKTGKSYMVYNALRNMLYSGWIIYMFETEGAPTRERLKKHLVPQFLLVHQVEFLKKFDIDIKIPKGAFTVKLTPEERQYIWEEFASRRVKFEQPEKINDVIVPVIRMTETMKIDKKAGHKIPKVAIVIDSITVLNSTKEYQDALAGKDTQDMGTRAKELKKLFNMLAVRCCKLGMVMINTAHVYEKDMGNFRKRVPSGGNAALFLSHVIPMLKKSDKRDDDKQRIGIVITSEMVESRFSKPVNITVYLPFHKGMNPYFGLHKFVDWDTCGIDKGKFIDAVDLADEMLKKKQLQKSSFATKKFNKAEFKKNLAKAKYESIDNHLEFMIDNGLMEAQGDGYYTFTEECKKRYDDKGVYQPIEGRIGVVNKNSNNWIVKHLGRTIEDKELLTPEVFTQEVLEQLDEKIFIPMFEFKEDDEPEEKEPNEAETSLSEFIDQK